MEVLKITKSSDVKRGFRDLFGFVKVSGWVERNLKNLIRWVVSLENKLVGLFKNIFKRMNFKPYINFLYIAPNAN